MKKTKTYYTNYRVEIDPTGLTNFGSVSISARAFYEDGAAGEKYKKEMVQRMEAMKDQIKRHVDYASSVHVMFDEEVEERCEHCSLLWEEEVDGTPMCCDKAIEEHLAQLESTEAQDKTAS